MTDTMQQVQLVEWGGPEVLHLAEVPVPEPVRGHVVVRVQAAGVNPIDTTTRKGLGPAAQLADTSKPVVLGWDIAGVVTAVAGDYTGFAVGDRVFGMVNFPVLGNTYAQYALVPAYQLAHAPDNVPMEQLGAAPLAAITAYQALFEVARLAAGERILIHAGAGGVGHMAIQLAVAAGAQVYATASARNREFVESLGAVCIDYTSEDFREALADDGEHIDVVLNSTGAQTFLDSLDVLAPADRIFAPAGRIVTLTSPDPLEAARERGFTAQWLTVHPDAGQLTKIAHYLQEGTLRVHLDRVFPLAEAAAAHEYIEQRHARGKVVLVP